MSTKTLATIAGVHLGHAEESDFDSEKRSIQEPVFQNNLAAPTSSVTQKPLPQSGSAGLNPDVVILTLDTKGRVHPTPTSIEVLSVLPSDTLPILEADLPIIQATSYFCRTKFSEPLCESERKDLEENRNKEMQDPYLENGEVDESQDLAYPCEEKLTLKSHEMSGVRSSDINLKEYRDLSSSLVYFAGGWSPKETVVEFQPVDPQSNSDASSADNFPIEAIVPESPQHSTGTEILELNTDAPVHIATNLEDAELNDDAEDEVAHKLKEPVADDDSSHDSDSDDGNDVDLSHINVDLDLDEDSDEVIFFEDMPEKEIQQLINARAKAQTQLDALKDVFHEVKFKYEHDLRKQLKHILVRQDKLEANQARLEYTQNKMSRQLDEVRQSMELIVSLLLGDDTKNGEIISQSKCKQLQLKDDDKDDAPYDWSKGENSLGRYKGGYLIGSSGILKPLANLEKTLIVTNADGDQGILEIEVGVVASHFLQTLKFKGKKTTLFYKDPKITSYDSEVNRRIFERENLGVDLEQLRLMEEEFKSLRPVNIDNVSPYEDIPGQRPTKGVGYEKVGESSKPVLKDLNTDYDISTREKVHVEDIPVKADEITRLTSDTAQVKETEIQPVTISDTTHVVDSTAQEKKNATSDITHVVDSTTQETKADHSIPERDSNSDLESSNADKPELTLEENKKLLWRRRHLHQKAIFLKPLTRSIVWDGSLQPIREVWTEYHEMGYGGIDAAVEYKIYTADEVVKLLEFVAPKMMARGNAHFSYGIAGNLDDPKYDH
ncbi:hypothetical protein AgCh_025415 [Apium graveolens]